MLEAKYIENLNLLIKDYLKKYNIKGKMAQVGGSLNPSPKKQTDEFKKRSEFWGLNFFNIDILDDNQKNTIIGDITNCPHIPDNSFNFIFSSDTFEHLEEPWKASKEMIRILKPGGLCAVWAPFSWRYHECPIDYWRFTPRCLAFLFKDLECLEANWDSRNRRQNFQGGGDANDKLPENYFVLKSYDGKHNILHGDVLVKGYWLENWRSYYIGRKKDGR